MSTASRALNCNRRHLYNGFWEEADGVAGNSLRHRLETRCRSLDARLNDQRSITEIAFSSRLSNLSHFSGVFRPIWACRPATVGAAASTA